LQADGRSVRITEKFSNNYVTVEGGFVADDLSLPVDPPSAQSVACF
jgi:hypothetical protein